MPRPKGLPKTGGRLAGVPNKRTRLFADVLEGLRFNIPEQAVQLYEELPPDLKLECLKFLAAFAHPKPLERESSLPCDSKEVIEVQTYTDQDILRLAHESKSNPK